MAQAKATRSIIYTHRHIFGPKLRQKLVENIGLDDSKPLLQAFAGEMFFYRESVDVDYSMEIQRQSGVTVCVNSYGGEVEMFAQHVIKASTIDTLKFLNDESFELRDRFPKEVACTANAHALEESSRDVIDPIISKKEACCISIASSYGSGPDQIFLDSPEAEWLRAFSQQSVLCYLWLRIRRGVRCALLLSMTCREGAFFVIVMTNSPYVFPRVGNCQADLCNRGDVVICDEQDLRRVGGKNYHKGCEPPAEEGPLGTERTSN